MMFGAGGTAVEVLRDTAHALPPLDLKLARDLMRQTRVSAAPAGLSRPARRRYRAHRRDAGAAQLSRRAITPQIREIDINPLLADDKGVIALDARVAVADPARGPRVPMAIRPYPSQWEADAELDQRRDGLHPPDPPGGRSALRGLLRQA